MQTENIFELQLGDVFGLEKYSDYLKFAHNNNYQIIELPSISEISSDGEKVFIRQYQICSPRPLTYVEQRQKTYPPLAEQLDMIYWDKVNNTHIWQETIAAIKTQFPKPVTEESDDR